MSPVYISLDDTAEFTGIVLSVLVGLIFITLILPLLIAGVINKVISRENISKNV